MLRLLIGNLLIGHGLIVGAQSLGSFGDRPGVTNPGWLSWWPTTLGRSWLFTGLGLERTMLEGFAGALWLVAGVAFVAAGLGVFGVLVPAEWWRPLAIAGAVVSLVMLLLYLHPFYAIGTAASLAVLISLLWIRWPAVEHIGR